MSAGAEETRGVKARREAAREVEPPQNAGRSADPAPLRILIVSQITTERKRLRARLAGITDLCEFADCGAAGLEALRAAPCDLALVRADLPEGSGAEWAAKAIEVRPALAAIIVHDDPTLDDAVEAMRAGAVDMVSSAAPAHELIARVAAASRRAGLAAARERRIERLTRVCRNLNNARQTVTRQVSSLCNDLVHAYQELSDRMAQVSIAAEFSGLVRDELEVEGLLRSGLEYILTQTGPTNAAVFLPSTSRDWSLGAYVNYSCPRDGADVLLETLAGNVAPKMEDEGGIVSLETPRDMDGFLGDEASWIADCCAVLFSCRHEDECLAVVMLFRDQKTPFDESLLPILRTLGDIFGRQLARVIHIHHRHLPRDQWGSFDQIDGGDDDLDLAA